MQRWIVTGVVMVMLGLGGGVFAYWTYKRSRPHPVWVPLPINREIPDEQRREIGAGLKAKLGEPEFLIQVSKELGLAKKMRLASDSEVAEELGRRLFVELGETASPMGRVPTINIGVTGKNWEKEVSGEIVMRLVEEVRKTPGSNPPRRQER